MHAHILGIIVAVIAALAGYKLAKGLGAKSGPALVTAAVAGVGTLVAYTVGQDG